VSFKKFSGWHAFLHLHQAAAASNHHFAVSTSARQSIFDCFEQGAGTGEDLTTLWLRTQSTGTAGEFGSIRTRTRVFPKFMLPES